MPRWVIVFVTSLLILSIASLLHDQNNAQSSPAPLDRLGKGHIQNIDRYDDQLAVATSNGLYILPGDRHLLPDTALITALWSADGTQIAAVSDTAAYIIAEDIEREIALTMPNIFSADWHDNRLAVGSAEGVHVFDAQTGNLFSAMTMRNVLTVAWSPDGETLAVGGSFGEMGLWRGEAEKIVEGITGTLSALAWSPDGTYVLAATQDATLHLIDPDGTIHATLTDTGMAAPRDVAWSPDGTQFATGEAGNYGERRIINVWTLADVLDGQQTPQVTYGPHGSSVMALAWSPDGLISASADGTIRRWTDDGYNTLYDGFYHFVSRITWLDAQTVRVMYSDAQRDWNITTGAVTATRPEQGGVDVTDGGRITAYTASGASFAEVDGSDIFTTETANGAQPLTITTPYTRLSALAWSPDEGKIATIGLLDDVWWVAVYDGLTGDNVVAYAAHPGDTRTYALAWSPDSRSLASGSWDGIVRLWDVPNQ